MRTQEILTRPLDCTCSGRQVWTLPAGSDVMVHRSEDGPKWLVALDGRVYRADRAAVLGAIVSPVQPMRSPDTMR